MDTELMRHPDFGSAAAANAGLVPLGKGHSQLTEAERTELEAQEQIIQERIKSFWEVGTALATIRSKNLWRVCCRSFEEYCKIRWGFNADRASHYTRASKVMELLTIGKFEPLPENERQVRPLVALLKTPKGKLSGLSKEEKAQELARRQMEAEGNVIRAYEMALKRAGGKVLPSGADVAKAVEALTPPKETKPLTGGSTSTAKQTEEDDGFQNALRNLRGRFLPGERELVLPVLRALSVCKQDVDEALFEKIGNAWKSFRNAFTGEGWKNAKKAFGRSSVSREFAEEPVETPVDQARAAHEPPDLSQFAGRCDSGVQPG